MNLKYEAGAERCRTLDNPSFLEIVFSSIRSGRQEGGVVVMKGCDEVDRSWDRYGLNLNINVRVHGIPTYRIQAKCSGGS